MKSNKLKKWLAAPYAVWAAGFIIIPLILILYYAFTGEEGGFTLSNFAYVATKENIKALGLALRYPHQEERYRYFCCELSI